LRQISENFEIYFGQEWKLNVRVRGTSGLPENAGLKIDAAFTLTVLAIMMSASAAHEASS
jgi:hypothetical protein